MKILFLTTHNLATNPRLYKEIQLAIDNSYEVEIICFEFDNWSRALNTQLIKQLGNVKITSIPAGRQHFIQWASSVLAEHLYRYIGKIIPLAVAVASQAISRRSSLLLRALKKSSKPDLIIGHNPGALYPACKGAQRFNCAVGFDAEDYHPGEGNSKYLQKLSKNFLKKILPGLGYVSFASPLIQQQFEKDAHNKITNAFTVLNYFPASEFKTPVTCNEGIVKMIWFSQNINEGRGIELILPFVKANELKIELHLVGNLNPDFRKKYLADAGNIVIHEPMVQRELHLFLAHFDLGLSLDIPYELNREFTITNKLLAYAQAGLYCFATNTSAQVNFFQQFQDHGVCFPWNGSRTEINCCLSSLVNNIRQIRSKKTERYNCFLSNTWENESKKLLHAWMKYE